MLRIVLNIILKINIKIHESHEFTQIYYLCFLRLITNFIRDKITNKIELISVKYADKEILPAQKFWQKVIAEYANNQYNAIAKEYWQGPVLEFVNN